MTTPTIADYLKYANLQTAAEAFIRDPETGVLNGAGTELINALIAGNLHTSKFTATEAQKFADPVEGWTVLDQRANTSTGFSGTLFKNNKTGELVMSFRSTEFIDDALRDNVATNTFEIKNTGFAWGQMADMEKWYAELQADSSKLQGKAFSVTGYSLGGGLATAFNLLHPGVAQQVVTFNGAGVGRVTQGTLTDALKYFTDLRNDPTLIDAALTTFMDTGLVGRYQNIRIKLANGTWTATQAKDWLTALYPPLAVTPQVRDILDSLDEIATMTTEATRIATLHAGGAGVGATTTPKSWDANLIEGEKLDYRMAVKLAAKRTESASTIGGGFRAVAGKSYADIQANQYDVVGDTSPSMVSNSQWHVGKDVRIFIEDQPLYRGGVIGDAASATWDFWNSKDYKLLVDNYALKDFGDTHSIVLLVDSLNIQNTLLQLVPQDQREATTPLLKGILQSVSNKKAERDATQGKAEADVLENVVNALGAMLIGPTYTPIKGNPSGGTWADFNNTGEYAGRTKFYETLDAIQKSPAYLAIAGKVQLVAAPIDGLSAKTDFGAFLSLYNLTPFSLKGNNTVETALANAWNTKYIDWLADKNLNVDELAQGKANFTDQYLTDRAKMLDWVMQRNIQNVPDGVLVFNDRIADDWQFDDRTTSTLIDVKPPIDKALPFQHKIIFGKDNDFADSINGGDYRDNLYGGTGNDTIDSGDGADYVEGNAGNDTLIGGKGKDQLLGGTGDDTLTGGKDNDILKGGEGNDTYKFVTGDGWDVITDSDGKGSIAIGDGSPLTGGKEKIKGSGLWISADNKFQYSQFTESDGSKTLNIVNLASPTDRIFIKHYSADKNLGIVLDDGAAAVALQINRTITGDLAPVDTDPAKDGVQYGYDDIGNVNVSGAEANRADVLNDSTGNDSIQAGGGDDIVVASRGGDDAIDGGAGSDQLFGGAGKDVILGGADSDILVGGADDDRLYASTEMDVDIAIAQGRTQDGTNLTGDWLVGGLGDDIVVAGAGNDQLFGGGGQDVIVAGAGNDVIDGDDDYQPAQGYQSSSQWNVVIKPDTFGVTWSHIVNADYARTVGAADLIYAGAGDDVVLGIMGDDTLYGEAGDDVMLGGDGNDFMLGGDGNDRLTGEDGLLTENSADHIAAVPGNDYMDGGLGNDFLQGEGGNDELFGDEGNDELWGDAHTYTDNTANGNDYLDGGDGNDTLNGQGGDDELFGGDGNDRLLGDDETTLVANQGKDYLDGEDGDDYLRGFGGNDELFGGDGKDTLVGDNGDDYLDGEDGDDQLDGGDGNDTLYGGDGNDTLEGGDGNDYLEGGAGTNTLTGGAGDDTLVGGSGTDDMIGGTGNVTMIAGTGSAKVPLGSASFNFNE